MPRKSFTEACFISHTSFHVKFIYRMKYPVTPERFKIAIE